MSGEAAESPKSVLYQLTVDRVKRDQADLPSTSAMRKLCGFYSAECEGDVSSSGLRIAARCAQQSP